MTTAYPDFPAAAIGWLRAQPSVVSAFAEDTTAENTTKFWADNARRGVDLPWAVYEEIDGDEEYMTAAGGVTSWLESGQLKFVIVAEGKKAARDLGRMIRRALNDAPLQFADGTLMLLRSRKPMFGKAGELAPDRPNAYVCVRIFEFMIQRSTVTS